MNKRNRSPIPNR